MTYEKHFGLRRRPFRPMPDSESYYPATGHEQALDRLVQGIHQDEGFVLLIAEAGLGKTLLCHRILEQAGQQTASAFLTNCRFTDRGGLLQALLYELSLPFEGRSEQAMRLALTDCLLENFKAGKRSLLVLDEAHDLSADLLEELRLLGNLEAAQGKAVQIVLAAWPVFLQTLHQPALKGLRQRLAVRAVLEPFGTEEAADYVVHQVRLAGGRPEAILAEEALTLLVQACQGVPRLLNQATSQALQLTASAGQSQVDAEAVLEALAILDVTVEATASAEAEDDEAGDVRKFPEPAIGPHLPASKRSAG